MDWGQARVWLGAQREVRHIFVLTLGFSRRSFYVPCLSETLGELLDAHDLTARVRAIHADSRGTYGAPRIHAELAEAGVAVGRKRVARVMRAAGIAGVSRRRGPRTTRRDVQGRPAPDRVERHFAADAPNRLWVADITYVPTLVGFLYLAIVLDVFSRRVVGPSSYCPQTYEECLNSVA